MSNKSTTLFNRQRYIIILLIITIAFIWGNSALPASISGSISGDLMKFLCSLTGFGEQGNVSDGYLRKFAHTFEFACLGTELFLLIRYNIKKYISSAVLFGLFTALIDETIQLFSEGRGSQVKDIWIDMLGFLVGSLITLIILGHYRRKMGVKLFDMALSVNGRDDKSGK